MRFMLFAGVFGLAMALGFGLLVTLGDPFEASQGSALFRACASTLNDLRPVVIDLVHHVLRVAS